MIVLQPAIKSKILSYHVEHNFNGVNVGRTANVVLPDDVLEVNGPISNGGSSWDNINSGNSTLKSIDLKNVRNSYKWCTGKLHSAG